MDKDTVIEMILVLMKEIPRDFNDDKTLIKLANIELKLLELKDKRWD